MKRILLLVAFCLATTVNALAQSSADQSGFAIQGIARDANNTARNNESIQLNLSFYYLNESGQQVDIVSINKTVVTDSFGVFSFTLDTNVNNNPIFSNYEAYLKITDNTDFVISDEKLKTVPYSISAANGVPTGAIMAFYGNESQIPNGWIACKGQSLNQVPGSGPLQSLLGTNVAPDLSGAFLRGVGTNQYTDIDTELGVLVNDTFESHFHELDLATSENGSWNPTRDGYNRLLKVDGSGTTNSTDGGDPNGNEPRINDSRIIRDIPNHQHRVDGPTFTEGEKETAPVHVGVLYMIKL